MHYNIKNYTYVFIVGHFFDGFMIEYEVVVIVTAMDREVIYDLGGNLW